MKNIYVISERIVNIAELEKDFKPSEVRNYILTDGIAKREPILEYTESLGI